ncbi:MAG: glycosyltransferase family 2 protein [Acutalibacteraceae bacterium]
MISIIIPIYNAESNLRRMLDSVLAQTYTDYECILVDDGSTDASYDVCKEYENRDSRFFCFVQGNGGVSSARNRGLELAKGDYITFLDADDSIPEHYLAELYAACKNADIAVCDTVIYENGKETLRFTHKRSCLTGTEAINFLLSRKHINSGPYSKLFKKEILKDLQFPPLKTYEDILFVLDAFTRAEKIAVTDKTEYHYIQNSDGAMSAMMKEPSADIIVATDRILQFISERKDLQPECTYVTVSHLYQYALPLLASQNYVGSDFIKKTARLTSKYMHLILSCKAIPWKEKMTFFLFAHGTALESGFKVHRIRKG